ncbi:MAG: fructosamine kinase family protein [Flammeovirgaceae bacterium]|nr:fructosamine kinase family protein [Flammeovirgaceae bacterium]MDW8286721.1 fructosamine kinase family protein [Flammeovirgaceae bacterium]
MNSFETNQYQFFESALFHSLGYSVKIENFYFESGGCINNALRLQTSRGTFFFKYNIDKPLEMFETEAKGLALLKESSCFTVPEVIGYGRWMDKSYLVLEFIVSRSPHKNYWKEMGEKLAQLHRQTHPFFGLSFDNFIGALPQRNEPHANWESFFISQRLRPLFERAYYHGLIDESYLRLIDRLSEKVQKGNHVFFPEEKPSLLHGDLWSGNVMPDQQGLPCIYDPAVYFGNREMELAFTRLFGGFDASFYDAYQNNYPLQKGYREREAFCNLYPLMVHVNLFGTGYLRGVKETLLRFV